MLLLTPNDKYFPPCQNLKKSWHPQTMKNIERVWKAEQKYEAERKKIEELQKELKDERSREEMTRYAEETGAIKSVLRHIQFAFVWVETKKEHLRAVVFFFYLCWCSQKERRSPGLDVPGCSWTGVQGWVPDGTYHWQADHWPVCRAWERSFSWDWPPARLHLQPCHSRLQPWPGCQDQRRPSVWNQVSLSVSPVISLKSCRKSHH